jgi:hypothetical protein
MHHDLALFNLGIDSKLRGCDLVKMKVIDVMASGQIKERASVLQSKTQKPMRFEISEGTRASLEKWMQDPLMVGSEYLWPGLFTNAFTSRPTNIHGLFGIGSHEDGQHRQIPRRRARRCSCDCGGH